MDLKCPPMGSVPTNDVKLLDLSRFNKFHDLVDVKASTRGAQDSSSFVVNVFYKFGGEINGGSLKMDIIRVSH